MAHPELVVADDEKRMTLIEHLEDLRRVLIISLIAWGVATVIGFLISGFVLEIMLRPIKQVLTVQNSFLPPGVIFVQGPVDKFFLYFKLGIFTGFVLSSPVIIWQAWTFVAPGLKRNERRFAVGFVTSALVLFAMGIGFAFFAMPIALRFLIGFGSSDLVYLPIADKYINFVMILIAIFGITFELPLALTMLGLAGIVTPAFLKRRRPIFWIGIFVGACLVTPGVDPFTPLLLTIPLIVLFEVSVLVISRLRR